VRNWSLINDVVKFVCRVLSCSFTNSIRTSLSRV